MLKSVISSRFLIFALIACSFGCASRPSEQCSVHDWYEEGRQHGLEGKSSKKENINNQVGEKCMVSFNQHNQDLYFNGRNAGLILYCSPQNGFLLGKNDKQYSQACPKYLEDNFLVSFNKGKQLTLMERTNLLIEKEMSALSIQLTRSPASIEDKQDLVKKLEQLKRTQRITLNEIKRLKSTAQTF